MAAVNPSDSQNTHELLSNLALPKTDATITIRIIKSFEFRTEKNLVLHHINFETTTVDDLKKLAREGPPCLLQRLKNNPLDFSYL